MPSSAMVKMKASMNLRGSSDAQQPQKPLLKAKLLANLLGVPIFTGVTVGYAHELALRLGTSLQEAGRSFEIAYRPNEPHRPFSLTMRASLGPWTSSNAATALYMATDFNLSRPGSPAFRLCIKPQAGDFSFLRKFHSTASCIAEEVTYDRSSPHVYESRPDVAFTNSFARSHDACCSEPSSNDVNPASASKRVSVGFTDDRDSSIGEDWENVDNRSRSSVPLHEDQITWISRHDQSVPFGEDRDTPVRGDWEHYKDRNSSPGRSSSIVSQNGDEGACEPERDEKTSSNASQQGVDINSFLGGSHLRVYSSVPISNKAKVNVRWRMQPPLAYSVNPLKIPLLPLLVLDKISFEAMVDTSWLVQGKTTVPYDENHENAKKASRFWFKDMLQSMQIENSLLKRALNNLKRDTQNTQTQPAAEEKHSSGCAPEEAPVTRFFSFRHFNCKSLLD